MDGGRNKREIRGKSAFLQKEKMLVDEQPFVTARLQKKIETQSDRWREVGAEEWVAISAQAWSDETLRRDNEDGSARSHSTLAQSQADPKVSTS